MPSDEQVIEAITVLRADGRRADSHAIATWLGLDADPDLEIQLLRLSIDDRIDHQTWWFEGEAQPTRTYWPKATAHGFDLDRFTEEDEVKAEFHRLRSAGPDEVRNAYAQTGRPFDDATWSSHVTNGLSDYEIAWLAAELVLLRRQRRR